MESMRRGALPGLDTISKTAAAISRSATNLFKSEPDLPSLKPVGKLPEWKVMFQEAQELAKRGEREEALMLYHKALRMRPNAPEIKNAIRVLSSNITEQLHSKKTTKLFATMKLLAMKKKTRKRSITGADLLRNMEQDEQPNSSTFSNKDLSPIVDLLSAGSVRRPLPLIQVNDMNVSEGEVTLLSQPQRERITLSLGKPHQSDVPMQEERVGPLQDLVHRDNPPGMPVVPKLPLITSNKGERTDAETSNVSPRISRQNTSLSRGRKSIKKSVPPLTFRSVNSENTTISGGRTDRSENSEKVAASQVKVIADTPDLPETIGKIRTEHPQAGIAPDGTGPEQTRTSVDEGGTSSLTVTEKHPTNRVSESARHATHSNSINESGSLTALTHHTDRRPDIKDSVTVILPQVELQSNTENAPNGICNDGTENLQVPHEMNESATDTEENVSPKETAKGISRESFQIENLPQESGKNESKEMGGATEASKNLGTGTKTYNTENRDTKPEFKKNSLYRNTSSVSAYLNATTRANSNARMPLNDACSNKENVPVLVSKDKHADRHRQQPKIVSTAAIRHRNTALNPSSLNKPHVPTTKTVVSKQETSSASRMKAARTESTAQASRLAIQRSSTSLAPKTVKRKPLRKTSSLNSIRMEPLPNRPTPALARSSTNLTKPAATLPPIQKQEEPSKVDPQRAQSVDETHPYRATKSCRTDETQKVPQEKTAVQVNNRRKSSSTTGDPVRATVLRNKKMDPHGKRSAGAGKKSGGKSAMSMSSSGKVELKKKLEEEKGMPLEEMDAEIQREFHKECAKATVLAKSNVALTIKETEQPRPDSRSGDWQQEAPEFLLESTQRLEVRPNSPGSSPQEYALAELKRIQTDFDEERYHKAHYRCERLIEKVQESPETEAFSSEDKQNILANLYSCMGNASLELGLMDKALDAHLQDLHIAQNTGLLEAKSRALSNVGRVHARAGRFRDAIDVWNDKVALCVSAEERAWLFHEIGRCYFEMKEYANAQEMADRAWVNSQETDDADMQFKTCYLLAQSYDKLMAFEEALMEYKKALDLAFVSGNEDESGKIEQAIQVLNEKLTDKMVTARRKVALTKAHEENENLPLTARQIKFDDEKSSTTDLYYLTLLYVMATLPEC